MRTQHLTNISETMLYVTAGCVIQSCLDVLKYVVDISISLRIWHYFKRKSIKIKYVLLVNHWVSWKHQPLWNRLLKIFSPPLCVQFSVEISLVRHLNACLNFTSSKISIWLLCLYFVQKLYVFKAKSRTHFRKLDIFNFLSMVSSSVAENAFGFETKRIFKVLSILLANVVSVEISYYGWPRFVFVWRNYASCYASYPLSTAALHIVVFCGKLKRECCLVKRRVLQVLSCGWISLIKSRLFLERM